VLQARLVAASSRANLEGRGQRWSEGSASPSRLKSAEAAFVVRAVDAPAGVRVSRAKAGLQPAKATSEAADQLPRPLPSPASLRHQQARQRGESTGGAWGEGRKASCRGRLLAHRQRTERARRAQQAAFAPRGANKMALRASRRDLCAGLMRSLCELRRRSGWLSMCRGRRRGFRPLLPHHLGTSSWPSGAACIERRASCNRVARVHAVNTQNTKSASKRPAALRAALAVGRWR